MPAPACLHGVAIYYDFIIVGSGFGWSMRALRLAENARKVPVFEKGKRLSQKDFPARN